MAGNVTGGRKAAAKNLANNPDFYRELGRRGGSRKVPKGFALNRELASTAGRTGGRISRRTKKDSTVTESDSSTQTTTQSETPSSASEPSVESRTSNQPWRRWPFGVRRER